MLAVSLASTSVAIRGERGSYNERRVKCDDRTECSNPG